MDFLVELGFMSMRKRRLQATLPLLVGVLLLALLMARGTALLLQWQQEPTTSLAAPKDVAPPRAQPSAVRDFAELAQLHLFGVADSTPQPEPTTELPETRAQLRLHGVLVDGEDSAAIIGEQGGRQHFVRLHEALPNGIELKQVYADRVILERQGRYESLRFPQKGTLAGPPPVSDAASGSPPNREVRSLSDLAGASAAELGRYLRVFPVQQRGTLVGYRVLPGREPRIYRQLGLHSGDIVTALDETPVAALADPVAFLQQLTASENVTLSVRRGDEIVAVPAPSP